MCRLLPSPGAVTATATRSRLRGVTLFCVGLTALSWPGCGGGEPTSTDAAVDAAGEGGTDGPVATGLRINELCPDDDGFQVDEEGQTDDWIELYNAGAAPVRLSEFTLGEDGGRAMRLPAEELAPGAAMLFWADGTTAQGPRHLAFRLSAGGGQVQLKTVAGAPVDEVRFPALATNTSWSRTPDGEGAFAACRYATPGRPNGGRCGPAPPVDQPPDVRFPPYTWPASFGQPAGPVVIAEAGLRPARFLELVNRGAAAEDLADLSLRIAALDAAAPWAGPQAGRELPWPRAGTLAPGERLVVTVDETALTEVIAAGYEGVVTLFRRSSGQVLHRLDFARLPADAVLALPEPASDRPAGTHRLCLNATPGAPNASCDPMPSRDVGDRLRQLQTPGDLAALAAGGAEVDSQAVKFVVDLQAEPGGGHPAVHFLSSRAWPLHYQFVRERIYQHPRLDRCSPVEAPVFNAGWQEFSDREYYKSEGRRFLLGTLVRYGGSNLQTIEFERADVITGPQMQHAFRVVAERLPDPTAWVLRAQGRQVEALRPLEATLPLVDADAPFRGVRLQSMDPGVAFGLLRFVSAAALGADTTLGRDVVLITDDVPNDVPLVGGLITEAFQTPLSHVSILSRNRGTPNMALRDAREDPRVKPLLDQLVRLEVQAGTFSLRVATAAEAQAFWEMRRPPGPRVAPRLDTNLRGLQELTGRGLDDLPSVGAKAAQLAELMRIQSADPACPGPIPTPPIALAIPVVHSLDHAAASGATALLAQHRARPEFAADPRVRAQALAEVRAAILAFPVDGTLVASVESRARVLFGTRRFRLRSSSNAEDLPGFSGAGLYQSVSVALGDPDRPLEDGIRQVWASLWMPRAYDERELANIDHERVAMGILINEAYPGVERANGVAVSRDVKNPLRGDTHYLSAQLGEASVTNPAPGVVSESLTYTWWLPTPVERLSASSLQATPVLAPAEIERISCLMRTVHQHFQGRLDPERRNRWFTMESEFKLVGQGRMLILKQARPYVFGSLDVPADCREL
jgi:Pyruvate phosphate dikinase, AMP/ATP-binding domain/Lamin Tail Domain